MIWRTKKTSWRGVVVSVAVGVSLGLVVATLYMAGDAAAARDPDVEYYEVDLSRELTAADMEAFIAFAEANAGRDIILQPVGHHEVLPGDERRQRDAERAAAEADEQHRYVQDGLDDGRFVDDPARRAACNDVVQRGGTEPGRFLLCEGVTVSAPSLLPARRVASRGEAEQDLDARLRDLLRGVTGAEEALGYTSSFDDDTALERVDLVRDGRVSVDFNARIVPQLADLHAGSTSHYMLEQVFKTRPRPLQINPYFPA